MRYLCATAATSWPTMPAFTRAPACAKSRRCALRAKITPTPCAFFHFCAVTRRRSKSPAPAEGRSMAEKTVAFPLQASIQPGHRGGRQARQVAFCVICAEAWGKAALPGRGPCTAAEGAFSAAPVCGHFVLQNRRLSFSVQRCAPPGRQMQRAGRPGPGAACRCKNTKIFYLRAGKGWQARALSVIMFTGRILGKRKGLFAR